jgi:hypothetical protein
VIELHFSKAAMPYFTRLFTVQITRGLIPNPRVYSEKVCLKNPMNAGLGKLSMPQEDGYLPGVDPEPDLEATEAI